MPPLRAEEPLNGPEGKEDGENATHREILLSKPCQCLHPCFCLPSPSHRPHFASHPCASSAEFRRPPWVARHVQASLGIQREGTPCTRRVVLTRAARPATPRVVSLRSWQGGTRTTVRAKPTIASGPTTATNGPPKGEQEAPIAAWNGSPWPSAIDASPPWRSRSRPRPPRRRLRTGSPARQPIRCRRHSHLMLPTQSVSRLPAILVTCAEHAAAPSSEP